MSYPYSLKVSPSRVFAVGLWVVVIVVLVVAIESLKDQRAQHLQQIESLELELAEAKRVNAEPLECVCPNYDDRCLLEADRESPVCRAAERLIRDDLDLVVQIMRLQEDLEMTRSTLDENEQCCLDGLLQGGYSR